MAWLYLIIAGILEVAWAIGLKYTHGWTRLWPSVFTAASMVVGFVCLSRAVKTIPIGTGYAVWTGIGTIGTAIFGVLMLGEPATAPRLLCILVIAGGIVGLKVLG